MRKENFFLLNAHNFVHKLNEFYQEFRNIKPGKNAKVSLL